MVREVLPTEVLRSTLPPTDKDLEEAENKLWTESYLPTIVYKVEKDEKGVETKVALNEPVVAQKYSDEAAKLPERIRTERAQQFQMYVDEGAIVTSEAVAGEGRTPSAPEMWYAQSALWVQQDVCRSIARLNANARNTLESPVKHLISLEVAADESQYVLATPAGGAAANPDEAAPAADPNAPLTRVYDLSPTGRVCNPLYDVVQFTMEVNVDARAVPQFLQELSREKFFTGQSSPQQAAPGTFITVNEVDLAGVNKLEALAAGYVYGEAPVVKLTLKCEALFMRRWTTQYMPPEVKQILGAEQAAPADASQQQASAER
jgi:hypothetical protein